MAKRRDEFVSRLVKLGEIYLNCRDAYCDHGKKEPVRHASFPEPDLTRSAWCREEEALRTKLGAAERGCVLLACEAARAKGKRKGSKR